MLKIIDTVREYRVTVGYRYTKKLWGFKKYLNGFSLGPILFYKPNKLVTHLYYLYSDTIRDQGYSCTEDLFKQKLNAYKDTLLTHLPCNFDLEDISTNFSSDRDYRRECITVKSIIVKKG